VTSIATSPATIDVNPKTAGTRGPKRFASVPLAMLPTTLKAAAGRKTSPAWSGVSPRCCWRKRLITKTEPKWPTMKANPAERAILIPVDRNSPNGIRRHPGKAPRRDFPHIST
jgi:hypothetical protein